MKKTDAEQTLITKYKSSFLIEVLLIIGLIYLLTILFSKSFLLFHCAIELFGAFIGSAILLVAVSLFKISKNYFFMTMGIGYFFVGILDILHALSYRGINIFTNISDNLVYQFWIAARFLEIVTIIATIAVLRVKKPNINFIVSLLSIIFVLLIWSVAYSNDFPERLINLNTAAFENNIEKLIIVGLFLCTILFSRTSKVLDKNLFLFLMISLILNTISEASFVITISFINVKWLLYSHIIKFISFYFMYKGVIFNGIQRPYEMLVHDLKKVGKNLESEIKLRSLMEDVISKNEEFLDLFINRSSDGIIIEKGQNFIYVNPAAVKILGGKEILDLYSNRSLAEDFKTVTLNQRQQAMTEKSGLSVVEYHLRNCNGDFIDIECLTSHIIYGGNPALFHMFRDISHKKKIKDLQNDIKNTELKLYQSNELNSILTEFFSNVSHELRTPLNIISSSLQLLQSTNHEISKEKLNKHHSIISQNTFRLIRIINNLIDVSKYDSGYLNLNLRNYNLVAMIEEITLSVVEYAANKGIELIFDTDVEEKFMAVDDDKIERIMLNLISNAIKFTNKGGQISVSLEGQENYLQISVKDTGIGIPKDKLDLIFERFGQVDKSLRRNREGSGIGLSLVKTFVEMHEGSIYVNSKYNIGSKFIIILPVKTVKDNGKPDYSTGNKVEKIKIEFSDIYPDSLPLSS